MKIPKGGNQKPEIREQQTIKWPQDTKGIIRSRKSENNRQYNGHKIPKGLSEAGNQRTTDNTMAKRKRIKGQITIYKTLDRK